MFSTKTKKPSPMLEMIATPLLAGVIAAGYNTFSESDDTYKNAMAFGMYAAIAQVRILQPRKRLNLSCQNFMTKTSVTSSTWHLVA